MEIYITIIKLDEYMGVESLRIGQELILKKDFENRYDDEAIKVVDENDCIYGYVANSVDTVARGTHSAGYIYSMDSIIKCSIEFILCGIAIAKLQ